MKIKGNNKRDKYFKRSKKKKLWNIKVTVIPVVIGCTQNNSQRLGKLLENLEIRGRADTIQTTSLLRSARTTSESPGDLQSLRHQ